MSTINLGTLTTPRNITDATVTTSDPTDICRFTLTETSNINLSLNEISAGDDADLFLYQDSNGNGTLDRGTDTLVSSSRNSFNVDDAINVQADAGTYFSLVERFAPGSSGNVTYDLDLSTTPSHSTTPSNLLPIETEVGFLKSGLDFSNSDSVSNTDTTDIYHFVVNTAGFFSFNLTGLTDDADIRLIQDSDGDRVVDANEEIARSELSGTSNDSITQFLNPGDNYFVQVYQYANANISYDLAIASA